MTDTPRAANVPSVDPAAAPPDAPTGVFTDTPQPESPAVARLRGLVQQAAPLPAPAPAPTDITAVTPTPEPPGGVPDLPLSAAEGPGEIGRLGGYRVTGVLGKGGMGVVLAAEDPRLGRSVALKVMLPAMAKDPAARERFLREARAAAAVEHENVVPIYQVAEDNGVPFLAMPRLTGVSLDDVLRMGRPVPVPMAVAVARQVADGLAAAHAAGLVHRDVKPSNVWLELAADGSVRRARVLDFGLARIDRDSTEVTRSGVVLGTPSYMAPEQARGQRVDPRADLFSLGVTLFQMATGKRPFTGTDPVSVIIALSTERHDPVRRLNPTVPPAMADLIDRLLAKDPAERPASAADVAAELAEIEHGLTAPEAEPHAAAGRGGWHRGALVAAAAAAFVAVLGVVVLRVSTAKGELVIESSDPDVEVVVRPEGGVTIHGGKGRKFELSPGAGVVEFRDPDTGAVASTETFRVERNGKTVVTARVAPKPPAPAPVAAAPPPPAATVTINVPLPPFPPPFPGLPPAPPKPDARAAVAAVLTLGGKVVVERNGKELPLGPGTRLPETLGTVRDVVLDGVTGLTAVAVAPLAGLPPVTRTLSLVDSDAGDTALGVLAACPAFADTPRVDVSGCPVTAAGLAHLGRLLGFRDLVMSRVRFGPSEQAAVAKLTNLTRLVVTGPDVTPDAIKRLAGLRLTYFDARNAPNLTEPGQLALAAQFPDLTDVVLYGVPVTDAGLRAFAGLANLRKLFPVVGPGVTGSGVAALGDAPNLLMLALLNYQGDPAALAKLAKAPKLVGLDLDGAKLTDADLVHLRGLKQVRQIQLRATGVSGDGVAALAAALPDARVEWDGGLARPAK